MSYTQEAADDYEADKEEAGNEWQAAWDKANAEYDALPWEVKVDRMAAILKTVTTGFPECRLTDEDFDPPTYSRFQYQLDDEAMTFEGVPVFVIGDVLP